MQLYYPKKRNTLRIVATLFILSVFISAVIATNEKKATNDAMAQGTGLFESAPTKFTSALYALFSVFGSFLMSMLTILYTIRSLDSPPSIFFLILMLIFLVLSCYSLVKVELPRMWNNLNIMLGTKKIDIQQKTMHEEEKVKDTFLTALHETQSGGKKVTRRAYLTITNYLTIFARGIMVFLIIATALVILLRVFIYFVGITQSIYNYYEFFIKKGGNTISTNPFNDILFGENKILNNNVFNISGITSIVSYIIRNPFIVAFFGIIYSFNELFLSYYRISKEKQHMKFADLYQSNRIGICKIVLKSILYMGLFYTNIPLIIMAVDPLVNLFLSKGVGNALYNFISPPLPYDYYKNQESKSTYAAEKKLQKILVIIGMLSFTIFFGLLLYRGFTSDLSMIGSTKVLTSKTTPVTLTASAG